MRDFKAAPDQTFLMGDSDDDMQAGAAAMADGESGRSGSLRRGGQIPGLAGICGLKEEQVGCPPIVLTFAGVLV
jgi:hypothetical protein